MAKPVEIPNGNPFARARVASKGQMAKPEAVIEHLRDAAPTN